LNAQAEEMRKKGDKASEEMRKDKQENSEKCAGNQEKTVGHR
jgi:hypothetical protein